MNFIQSAKHRILYISTFVFLLIAGPMRANAESPAITDTAPNAPAWLLKAASIFTEPLGWIKWVAVLGGVLLIAVNGLKYKAANGDSQKMDKALSGMKSTAIGAFIIFSAAGIGQWFFGKLQ